MEHADDLMRARVPVEGATRWMRPVIELELRASRAGDPERENLARARVPVESATRWMRRR